MISVRRTDAGLVVHGCEKVEMISTALLCQSDHIEVTDGRVYVLALNGTWVFTICGFENEGRMTKLVYVETEPSRLTGAVPMVGRPM